MQAFLSWLGILLAAGVYFGLKTLGLSTSNIFTVVGFVTLAATFYVLWLLPDSFLRLLLVLLTNTIYRIQIRGRDHIPDKGGVLFVCNHLSYIDALFLFASIDRPVRFIMSDEVYRFWYIKPFAKILKVIPMPTVQRPRGIVKALREASARIKAGEVVCIFAEGRISRTGDLMPFRRGFARIMRGLDNPIIPVNLGGVWGSIFSYEGGRFLWKMPKRIPYPVSVDFGQPMAANSQPEEVRQAVRDLARGVERST